MPVFEDNENITDEEFARMQRELNDKVARISWAKLVKEFSVCSAHQVPIEDCDVCRILL